MLGGIFLYMEALKSMRVNPLLLIKSNSIDDTSTL